MTQEALDVVLSLHPDIQGEGYLLMIEALKTYDPKLGKSLKSYLIRKIQFVRMQERSRAANSRRRLWAYKYARSRPSKPTEAPTLPKFLDPEVALKARGYSRKQIALSLGIHFERVGFRQRRSLDFYRFALPRPGRHTP